MSEEGAIDPAVKLVAVTLARARTGQEAAWPMWIGDAADVTKALHFRELSDSAQQMSDRLDDLEGVVEALEPVVEAASELVEFIMVDHWCQACEYKQEFDMGDWCILTKRTNAVVAAIQASEEGNDERTTT